MRLFLLCIIFLCKSVVYTQQITTQYTVNNGLQSNEVYQIEKDKFGQLWICSDRGLVSFNGSEFSYFDATNGLKYPNVTSIYKFQNTLLFSEFNGGFSYLDKNNTLKQHWLTNLVKPYLETYRYAIQVVEKNGFLYLSYKYLGILVIDLKKQKVLKVIKRISKFYSVQVIEENQCILLIEPKPSLTSPSNTFNLEIDTKKLKLKKTIKSSTYPSRLNLISRKNGGYSVYYCDYLFEVDSQGKLFENQLNKPLLRIQENEKQELILSFWQKGCEILEPNTLYKLNKKRILFPKTSITSFCYDNEKGVWISTHGNGVYYISNKGIQFENIFNKSVANQTFDIYKCDKKLYLCKKDESVGELVNTTFIKKFENFKGYNYYFRLFNKDYLFGHLESFFIRDFHRKSILGSSVYDHIIIENHLVLANFGSITLVDLKDNFSILIQTGKLGKRITSLQLAGNDLYAGTTTGLYWIENFTQFLNNRNALKTLEFKPFKKQSIFEEAYIKDVVFQNNQLIFATIGNGLILYNPFTNRIKKIIKKDGLFSNNIEDLDQHENKIYTTSFQGINEIQFIKDTFFIRNLASSYDLKLSDPFKIEYFNGYLYLLHSNGLGRLKMDESNAQVVKNTPCYITEIHAAKFHFKGMTKQFPTTLSLKKSNDLSVRFAGVSYCLGKGTKYKYRIKGWNNTWKYTENKLLTFPFLSSGKYQLEIAAIDELNNISNQKAVFSFEIVPPFYKSAWFFIIITLLIIGLIFFFFFLRTRILENKMKFNLINQKATVAQINPHFIFNILNSINSDILLEDRKIASKTLINFSNLMRQNLDNSSHALVSLENDLEALKYYLILEENRMENFTFQIIIQDEINSSTLLIPPMLIQPFVENVMRHAFVNHSVENKGEVIISIHFEENDLKCCVTDNGIGLTNSLANKKTTPLRKSMGMAITRERLEFLTNYYKNTFELTVSDNLENTTGTKVCFNLPFQRT